MKQKIVHGVVMLCCLYAASAGFAAQNGQDLYQQALVQERAAGDLEKAIELFQNAAAESAGDRELAAKALIGAARCYEKLGEARSKQLYEEVARAYPDQREPAAFARERIASSSAPAPVATNAGALETIKKLTEQLTQLRSRYEQLSQKYSPEHPQLARIRSEGAAIQEALRTYRDQLDPWTAASINALVQLGTKPAEFDTTKPVTITGRVKSWEFINPNVYLHIEVQQANGGTVVYHIKGAAPRTLVEQGVRKEMIRLGEVVTVNGFPSRDPTSPTIGIATVTVPGGLQVFLGNSLLY